jgi:hypothetical protein
MKKTGKEIKNDTIKINRFVTSKLGLDSTKTILKIDDFLLAGAIARISKEYADILVILSQKECIFFQRCLGQVVSLRFSLLPYTYKRPLNFYIVCYLDKIDIVKYYNNTYVIKLLYANTPNDLNIIIDNYMDTLQALQEQFMLYSNEVVEVDKEASILLNYLNRAECRIDKENIQVLLLSISVNKVIFAIPKVIPDLEPGANLTLIIHFRNYCSIFDCTVRRTVSLEEEFWGIECEIGFNPELVELISNYLCNKRRRVD